MKIIVHDTLAIYQAMIDAETAEQKRDLFENKLLSPFKPAIATLMYADVGMLNATDAVKNWGFMLPDEFTVTPPALSTLIDFGAWKKAQTALNKCSQQFANSADAIPLEEITFGLFLGKPNRANPLDRGYTGMGGIPGTIFALYSDPNHYNLGKFNGLVAHEFHHNIHLSLFPWDHMEITLAQWMIYEGMAESFATALYGDDMLGYYMTDFDMSTIQSAKQIIANNLQAKGFQTVRSYIYGDALADAFGFEKVGLPAFAGYAIGYHVVQAYLEKTGQSVVEATCVVADEIIRVSEYFDPTD